ncbi:cytochrome P450, family 72, subfamily A, polypeptide 8 [Prunus dulcis]|uniref:Cytochrome P450, family 72, subfamily A, polypeptide 8 n=1 Tax=Prunus dulcis TaxID=3755 RepID=A0A4Y1QR64_PRUDU|nr:cytochrome P450, family 72, subfamily A, polypeptide 8 [Prunus dulcis]
MLVSLLKPKDEVESKKLEKGIREGIIEIVKKREDKAIMIGETDSFGNWQEEARKEILQIFGKQTLNSDSLAKLKTMGMIINESLRLYPPIVSIARKVEREVRLGKLIVSANVEIFIPSLAIHHEPQL